MLLNHTQKSAIYNLAVYAPPGTGKTFLGCTSPKPLILLTEKHGFETIRLASQMLGIPMPPTVWLTTTEQVRRVVRALQANHIDPIAQIVRELMPDEPKLDEIIGALPYVKPESIVIDSLTELGDIFAREIDEQGGREVGKDGLEVRKLKAWGPIADKVGAVIKALVDLPYHTVFLALMNERNHGTEDHPDVHREPDLPGRKLPKVLCKYVNALGVMRLQVVPSKDGDVRLRRWVQFAMSDDWMTKIMRPLRDKERPNVTEWIEALSKGVEVRGDNAADALPEQPAEDANTKTKTKTKKTAA